MLRDSKPTDAELAILKVLWTHGPSTVRAVHNALKTDSAYTTTLKMLQIMHDKGLVQRDTSERSHVYRPSLSEEQVQRSLVTDLLDRAFGGSVARLAMRALSLERASPAELAELRAMLDEQEAADKPAKAKGKKK